MIRTVVLRALAVGLTLVLFVAVAPTLHEHRALRPALYDDECPLAQLGASGIEGGLPRVVDLVAPLPPVEIVVPDVPRASSGVSRLSFGPRGPPHRRLTPPSP